MGDERTIPIGYVRRAHGIKGEIVVKSLTDDPTRFATGGVVHTDETPARRFEIRAARSHRDGALLALTGVTDRNTAEAMQGVSFVIAPAERRSLDTDEYWPDDLIGLEARDADGARLGVIEDVVLGAAQDRLAVRTDTGVVVEVPFVAALVGEVDLAAGIVTMTPPEGLFPDPV